MYPQQYPVIDNTVYLLQQQQQQQQKHQQQHQQQHYQQPRLQSPLHVIKPQKEPLPSATDAKPNITLTITEIAEFSSTMVYLMWHARRQSVMDLHSNSKSDTLTQNNNTSLEQTRVIADMANMTSAAFKKYCRQILSATQLSESVILLSLKYIAMLLQNNPNIQGADGSEYRLFTVALMLANKFLDDNTFTNKTWSEVSGMKVTDLNIMELEFLDVLKFKLSVHKEEYERWRTALFGFRSLLLNVPVEIQRQKLMETMALSVNNSQQQWYQQQQQQQ
ncbi:MAG: cyclin-domain-containing protein, partial [Benjaminiella poitrasii]